MPPLNPYGGVLVAHQDSRVPPRKPPSQKGAHVGQQEDQRQHTSRGLKLSPCLLKGTLLLLFTAELLKIRPLDFVCGVPACAQTLVLEKVVCRPPLPSLPVTERENRRCPKLLLPSALSMPLAPGVWVPLRLQG